MRRAALALALLAAPVSRHRLRNRGATRAERSTCLPGDELIGPGGSPSTMAATLPAPPEAIWPWLAQMGTGRAGFYSWDRLDNGGHPSAWELYPQWQHLAAGDRIPVAPDQHIWFDVARAEPPHCLVLRSSLTLPELRPFTPGSERPPFYSDAIWSFHLRAMPGGRTRLLVRSRGVGRPALLLGLVNLLAFDAAHVIMQTKQLAELRRRAELAPAPAGPASRPVEAVAA